MSRIMPAALPAAWSERDPVEHSPRHDERPGSPPDGIWRSRANGVNLLFHLWRRKRDSQDTLSVSVSLLKSARWSKWTVIMATCGWIFLIAASYLQIPLYRQIWLFSPLVITFAWLWACLWSFTAVASYLSVQAYARAALALIVAVTL